MFVRVKKVGPYQYLQIAQNRREGKRVKQSVIATLGRLDKLTASGAIDQLLRSAARFPVRVDTDRLRPYHRAYGELIARDARTDPLGFGLKANAASIVQPEATRWSRALLGEAISERLPIVYETTGGHSAE